ncbi:aldehyde dehydrogenase family protein [Actinomadura graeca]|uniref:Aldehyde dehydrogenase family protein n=1 Tax=Actinomadura graeca TaxID=2750812 RepID=A0ABX8QXE7_9ACTN|nr:aldehyde dehydrogenase family protein [Actinomadura graeca]QXJ23435.1 aldehyde dehydrogenase family protein [Actinomadura graeca]
MATDRVAPHLINGVLIGSGQHSTSYSPATGEPLGRFADADRRLGEQAIDAAKTAYDSTDWRRDRRLRHRVLQQLADLVEAHTDELVHLLAEENGKTLGEAGFELSLTPGKLRYYAALALTDGGRAAEVRPGVHLRSAAEPVGVAGVIVPWNSPVVLSVRSFAPALAAGCTVVMKLAGQTGLVNGRLHEILAQAADLPTGVINSVTESKDDVARLLVTSPDVAALSYTGSTRVGRLIMAEAAPTLKRLSLELGGKTPMVVFDDANLDAAVPVLTAAVTTFAGQFCMTGSRILAQSGIAARLRERLAEALGGVRVGPGTDPRSQMGPMIDAANAARVDAEVDAAIGRGARALVRGGRPEPAARNGYYRPTLLEVADAHDPIVRQEVFGPVATFETFDTEGQAIDLANATEYGLAASVWTRDVDRPVRVGRRLAAGTVWTNTWAVVEDQFEEGGFGQSGLGRLNGPGGLAEFQEHKTYVHVVS